MPTGIYKRTELHKSAIRAGVNEMYRLNPEVKVRMSKSHKGKIMNKKQISSLNHNKGELSNGWKGDKVSYSGLHKWLKRNVKKTGMCIDCKKNKKTDWSNISGKYLRNIKDFEERCRSCHIKYDKENRNTK